MLKPPGATGKRAPTISNIKPHPKAKAESTTNINKKFEPVVECICSICKKQFPSEKLKFCSRCHEKGYCSKECQVLDWPSHKKKCKKISAAEAEKKIHEEAYQEKVVRLLSKHANKKVFSVHTTRKDGEKEETMVSIADYASWRTWQNGKGVLILKFDDSYHSYRFIQRLIGALQNPPVDSAFLPPNSYEKFPFRKEFVDSMRYCGGPQIEAMIADTGPQAQRFALIVDIKKVKYVSLMAAPFAIGSSSYLHPAPTKQVFTRQVEFSEALKDSPEYMECRQLMGRIQNGRPGVLFLKNFIGDGEIMTRKDLKRLTPEKLLNALKLVGIERLLVYEFFSPDKLAKRFGKSLAEPFLDDCAIKCKDGSIYDNKTPGLVKDPNVFVVFYLYPDGMLLDEKPGEKNVSLSCLSFRFS